MNVWENTSPSADDYRQEPSAHGVGPRGGAMNTGDAGDKVASARPESGVGLVKRWGQVVRSLGLYASGKTAPGPRTKSPLGKLPELQTRGLYPVLSEAWHAYGDLACMRVGTRLVYLVAHPDYVVDILLKRRDIYTKHSHRARMLIGNGLPASTGTLWRRQRRILQPHFSNARIRRFSIGMEDAAARMVERFEGYADTGRAVDISAEMLFFALDAVCRAITGEALGGDLIRLRQAMDRAVAFVSASRQIFRPPLWLPLAKNRQFKRDRAAIYDVVRRAIARRRQEYRRDKEDRAQHRGDLLRTLLNNDGDAGMSEEQLCDEIISVFLAGHETTARALSWTWYLLDQHPQTAVDLCREFTEESSGRAQTDADATLQLAKLPLFERVFAEVLRLYPPNWVFPRVVMADDVIGGCVIPAGSTVMISPYLLHRHPDFWQHPDSFRPERFLPAEIEKRPQGCYIPFGFGPRMCLGNRFATLEAAILLSSLLPRFQLSLVPGRAVEPRFATALQPEGGLWMTVKRRNSLASAA